MAESNPWDRTVRDPLQPELAIGDPLHGPSAVHNSLQIPAMPLGDGTYYQPGAFYTLGTGHMDSQDRPVLRLGTASSAFRREIADLQEWVEAYHQGEEALTALEGKRQQTRLERTRFAHCYKPSDVCPGSKKLEVCETGNAAYQSGQEWTAKNNQEKAGEGIRSSVLAWAGGKCVECSVLCQVTVETRDGKPQETCVSFYKRDPNIPVVTLDLTSGLSPITDIGEAGTDKIQLARSFYKGLVCKDPSEPEQNNNNTTT